MPIKASSSAHGTALGTIINFYHSGFGGDAFKRIWHLMPYILLVTFDGLRYESRAELLGMNRGYPPKKR